MENDTTKTVQSAKRMATDIELTASSDQMKITELNPDCLEHIFKYLHLKDLLNIADARKSLQDPVNQAFISKYHGKTIVSICPSSPLSDPSMHIVTIDGCKSEDVYSFGAILKFLRYFGKKNTALKIVFRPSMHGKLQNRITELCNYINEYCTETLTELELLFSERGFIPLLKPFRKLETLALSDVPVDDLLDLNRCFPKLCWLKLYSIPEFIPNCFQAHLLHLPHLKVLLISPIVEETFVKICLQLNPQLEILEIIGVSNSWDPSILDFVNENILQLKELRIVYSGLLWYKFELWLVRLKTFIKQHTSLDKVTVRMWKTETEMLGIVPYEIYGWHNISSITHKYGGRTIVLVRTNKSI